MDNNNDEFIYEDKQPEQQPEVKSQVVSPIRGFFWLERGLSDVVIPHFGKWFAAGLVYASLVLLVQMFLPIVGIALSILLPIFLAGGIIGAINVFEQKSPEPIQFFTAFKHSKLASLFLYTALHFVLIMVIGAVVVSIIGVETLQALDLERMQDPNDQEYALYIAGIIKPMMTWLFLLSVVYLFLTWFAPSLIIHGNKNPFVAISESFFASVKNLLAFIVLILLIIVIAFVLSFVFGLLFIATGLLASGFGSLFFSLSMTALIMPIYVGALYVRYREVFLGDVKKSERSL